MNNFAEKLYTAYRVKQIIVRMDNGESIYVSAKICVHLDADNVPLAVEIDEQQLKNAIAEYQSESPE